MHPPRSPALFAIAFFFAGVTPALFAQAPAAAPAPAAKAKLGSMVLDWEKMTAKPTKIGERRDLFEGPTPTLTNFESHITTLNPGESPHAPHRHPDEELIVVKVGTIEVTINGEAKRAGPGSVFFFASNDLHGMKNVGNAPATYFVFRLLTATTPKPEPAAK